MKSIDELLQTPCWIVDILPKRVPADSPGQYFAVERYFLDHQLSLIREKHIHFLLKLNCYRALSLEDGPEINPPPEKIAEVLQSGTVNLRVGEALIVSETDLTYLTVFNAEEELLRLLDALASAEGLFLWKGADQENKDG